MEHRQAGGTRIEYPFSVLKKVRRSSGDINVVPEKGHGTLFEHGQIRHIHLQLFGLVRGVKRINSEEIAGDPEWRETRHSHTAASEGSRLRPLYVHRVPSRCQGRCRVAHKGIKHEARCRIANQLSLELPGLGVTNQIRVHREESKGVILAKIKINQRQLARAEIQTGHELVSPPR